MTIDEAIKIYGKRLYGLCLTLCARQGDAEDLYQDTWLKVIRHMDHYDQTRDFEPWLTRICVNTYRNRLRRISKNPVFNTFSSIEDKDRVLDTVIATPKEDYTELHRAVLELPEKLKVTVILYYFKDTDQKSVAKVLGVPVGTVKSRLDKAKKLLKEALKDDRDIQL